MPTLFPNPVAPGVVSRARLDAVEQVCAACRRWAEPSAVHLPYIDLTFAFGLATLGDAAGAERLFAKGAEALSTAAGSTVEAREEGAVVAREVRRVLLSLFQFRIEQALKGATHTNPVSGSALAEWDELVRRGAGATANFTYTRALHAVGVYRMVSQVLDPVDRIDPYRAWTAVGNELERRLVEVENLRAAAAITERVGELVRGVVSQATFGVGELRALRDALSFALRAGEGFTTEVLTLMRPAVARAADAGGQHPAPVMRAYAELLRQGLLVAGFLRRTDLAGDWATLFVELTERLSSESRLALVWIAGPQCQRSLRLLGLANHIDQTTARLRAVVPTTLTHDAPSLVAQVLKAELVIAAGWLVLGRDELAVPVLERARQELLGPVRAQLLPLEHTELARAYVFALGQGGAEPGPEQLAELFRELPPEKVTNPWTTVEHFSRSHLLLTEEAAAAACQLTRKSSA